jgi:hypothetical protein
VQTKVSRRADGCCLFARVIVFNEMRSKNDSKRKTDVNAKKRNLKSQKESVGNGGKLQNLLDWDVEWSNRFASFMQSKLPGVTAMFENKFMEV